MVVTYNNTVITTDKQIQSTLATGTSPLSVSSTTAVANLNADTVDGKNEADIVKNWFQTTYQAVLPGGVTNYIGPTGALQASDTAFWVCPRVGTVKNLYVWSNTASGVGVTDTYAVMKNTVVTALTIALTNVQSNQDTANSFTVAAGDRLSVRVVSGPGTAAANISIMFEITT